MADCQFNKLIDAYHDGELDAAQHETLRSHLSTCGECSARLARLEQMSGLFVSAIPDRLSQIARHRLHRHVAKVIDRGVIRLAWSFSAVAAAVVLAGSVWLLRVPATPQSAPPWVAVNSVDSSDRNNESPVAQWYLADASDSRSSGVDLEGQ
jgi:anti-sigma factor RsiW